MDVFDWQGPTCHKSAHKWNWTESLESWRRRLITHTEIVFLRPHISEWRPAECGILFVKVTVLQSWRFCHQIVTFRKSMPHSAGRHSEMCDRRKTISVCVIRWRCQLSNDMSYSVQFHLCADLWQVGPCQSKTSIFHHFYQNLKLWMAMSRSTVVRSPWNVESILLELIPFERDRIRPNRKFVPKDDFLRFCVKFVTFVKVDTFSYHRCQLELSYQEKLSLMISGCAATS